MEYLREKRIRVRAVICSHAHLIILKTAGSCRRHTGPSW